MPNQLLHIEDLGGPHQGHRVLCLRGPLIISNLFQFQSTVRANTTSFLILDLTQVPYVDSAGVGALVGAYVTHDNGRRLALVGVTERVRNTMHVAHVEQFFQFYETLKAAQEAHKPSPDLSKGPGESSAREEDGPGRKSSLIGTLAESWGDTHSPQQVTS
ncbi:MAG TPA: STAS domain-containing protein [Terriglobales bacterium]|nr:STAS domain-containing protein [Terriglobales bacterium]